MKSIFYKHFESIIVEERHFLILLSDKMGWRQACSYELT